MEGICRKLYFSMGMCVQIAQNNAFLEETERRIREGTAVAGEEVHVQIGHSANISNFIDAYVRFLAAQNLAVVDFSDYLIDLQDRNVYPIFIYPLTSRGVKVVRFLKRMENAIKPILKQSFQGRDIEIFRDQTIVIHYQDEEDVLRHYTYISTLKDFLIEQGRKHAAQGI